MNLPSDNIVDFVEIIKHQSSVLEGLFKEIVCISGGSKLKIIFNDNGLVQKEIEHDYDGGIFSNLYSYSNDKVISVTRTMDDKVLWIANYYYDNYGYSIQTDVAPNEKLATAGFRKVIKYKYDTIKNLIVKYIEINDDVCYTFTFNTAGHLLGIKYNDGRKIEPIVTRIGNEVKIEIYEREKTKIATVKKLLYSENGKLLLYETQYLNEKKTITFEYIYNDSGLLEILNRNGKIVARISYHI